VSLYFSKKLVTDTRRLARQAKHEWPYQLASSPRFFIQKQCLPPLQADSLMCRGNHLCLERLIYQLDIKKLFT
jgi:hypothetical protein